MRMICRRITGSRPSTGSSRMSTSGGRRMASQKAVCFCMPLEKRRMGLALVEGEDLPQPVKPPFVEAWVGRSIELFEISDAVTPLKEDLIGDIDHDPFLFEFS